MKKKCALILCCAMLLALVPAGAALAADDLEPINVSFTDDDMAAIESRGIKYQANEEAVGDIVKGDISQDDDGAAMKMQHGGSGNYSATPNAFRLTFDEPLPTGGIYTISAWVYVPSEGDNPSKNDLKWANILINGNSASNDHKHPTTGSKPALDTWLNVTFTTMAFPEDISFIDFRFYGNTFNEFPDLWYIDNITITQDGSETIEVVDRVWDVSLPSLAERYSDYFLFGNIMSAVQTEDAELTAMYKHYYNAVTAENDMKPQSTSNAPGIYNFANGDKIVDWAQANGQTVIGHTLVWHSQSAAWLTTGQSGAALTRDEARANMEEYIKNVAGHYAGKVQAWDVVNEAFKNSASWTGNWKDGLRKTGGSTDDSGSPWYAAYENGADTAAGESGADYIYDAFRFARKYDPNATLYYNDFNDLEEGKSTNIAAMVTELNKLWEDDPDYDNRLLIEGIGLQSHHNTSGFSLDRMEAALARYIATGAVLSITELDFPVGSTPYDGVVLSDADSEKQATLYAQFFNTLIKYSEKIERVTIWGKTDFQSWRGERLPLHFDTTFAPKESFYAILDPAAYLSGGVDAVLAAIADGTVGAGDPGLLYTDQNSGSGDAAGDGTGDTSDTGVAPTAAPSDASGGDGGSSFVGSLEFWLIIAIVVVVVGVVVAVVVIKKKK